MAYLPKHKEAAKEKLKELGAMLFDPKTGLPFRGDFIQDFLGRVFKGKKLSKNSEPLEVRYPDTQSDRAKYGSVISVGGSQRPFISEPVKPSPKDYESGKFPRHFSKDSRTGKIIEITPEIFKALKKEKKLYRRTLKIEWYVTGNPEDEIINGYKYPGTKAKNQDVIDQAEKILPGIGEQILKDPSQFVVK